MWRPVVFQVLPSTADFFSCLFLVFWTPLSERSIYGRLLLERYFSSRDITISLYHKNFRPSASSFPTKWYFSPQNFFRRSITWFAYDYHTLLLRKISFKTQLKLIFLIKLKLSEAGKNNLLNWGTTLKSLRKFC